MLMPKKDRVAIYEYLFKEGVMVAEKDFHFRKAHPALTKVPNLHVIRALQSLKSRGYVKEQFSWRHYYWYLTNEGINYLREYLHLPPEIVPATLKRTVKPDARTRDKRMKFIKSLKVFYISLNSVNFLVDDAPSRGGAGGRESYRQNEGYVSLMKVKYFLNYNQILFFFEYSELVMDVA